MLHVLNLYKIRIANYEKKLYTLGLFKIGIKDTQYLNRTLIYHTI